MKVQILKDKNNNPIMPITHVRAVAVNNNENLEDILKFKIQTIDTEDVIDDVDINYLSTTPQTLTNAEKQQVKENLDIREPDLSGFATIESVDFKIAAIPEPDLSSYIDTVKIQEYAKKSELPTKLSQFTNDTDYVDTTSLNNKQNKIMVSDHGTSNTTFTLTPNILHIWGTVTALNLTLGTASDTTIVNYYMFQFTSGTTATTLTLPASVKWNSELIIEANKTYQVIILNNCAVIGGF